MLNKEYFDRLSKYIGKDISWRNVNHKIVVKCDVESSYTIERIEISKFLLYYNERGIKSLVDEYDSVIELRRRFALRMKNYSKTGDIYHHFSEFNSEGIDIKNLKNKMEFYCNSDYYSIK